MTLSLRRYVLAIVSLTVLFIVSVLGNGLPILRHDWSLPAGNAQAYLHAISAFQAWQQDGLGHANPYPLNYIFGLLLAPIGAAGGGFAQAATLMFLVVLVAWLTAYEIADGAKFATITLLAFLLFNPWIYTEIVAGHLYMSVSCYALGYLISATIKRRFALGSIAISLVLIMQQMQFLLPAMFWLAILSCRERRFQIIIISFVITSPVWFGLATQYQSLLGVPFNLSWELQQSVSPFYAFQFLGYFANYNASFSIAAQFILAVVIVASAAIIRDGQWRSMIPVWLIGLVVVLISSGGKWLLAPAFDWGVAHVKFIAVYRELYDVLGALVICYAFLLSKAMRSRPYLSIVVALATLPLIVTWAAKPPLDFFVSSNSISDNRPSSALKGRIALLPPFQPLSYRGRGAGLDPDAYTTFTTTPLNQAFPTFPVQSALSQAWLNGNYSGLSALGATHVIYRPDLVSNLEAMRGAWSVLPPARMVRNGGSKSIDGAPELSLIKQIHLVTVDLPFGQNSIFFADAPCELLQRLLLPCNAPRITAIGPSPYSINLNRGWVATSQAAFVFPEVAQSFGGAVTTDPLETLQIKPNLSVLALVHGVLRSNGGQRWSGFEPTYHWLKLGPKSTELTCSGLCAVAVEANPPSGIPENAARAKSVRLSFRRFTPWILTSRITASKNDQVLKLNDLFDPGWSCWLSPSKPLLHFRLDRMVNGWMLPKGSVGSLLFINVTAALQTLLEILGFIVFCVFAAWRLASFSVDVKRSFPKQRN